MITIKNYFKFTGVNNFTTDTISDNRYNEFFGFTEDDVKPKNS